MSEISASGSSLVFSTYLGGTQTENSSAVGNLTAIGAIAVDNGCGGYAVRCIHKPHISSISIHRREKANRSASAISLEFPRVLLPPIVGLDLVYCTARITTPELVTW